MIEQRIQDLFREAVFKTAVQGTRCGATSQHTGEFVCLYTNDLGQHCAVGHALTPELQVRVGDIQLGITALVERHVELQDRLGYDMTKPYLESKTARLWSALQTIHDEAIPDHRKQPFSTQRPFGVSWSAWFWYRARSLGQKFGFDIGNYPRAEVRDAQAA